MSEHGSEGFRVRLRRLSEYGSVACLVERPTQKTQAEQYLDTALIYASSHELSLTALLRECRGGVGKIRGGGKPHEEQPSQQGVLDPPSSGMFSSVHSPRGAIALFLLYQSPQLSKPEAPLEGFRKFSVCSIEIFVPSENR